MGKITSNVIGCIVEPVNRSLMFLPGSQISDKPLKDISHLMNELKNLPYQLDKIREMYSRKEIISSQKEIKQKL